MWTDATEYDGKKFNSLLVSTGHKSNGEPLQSLEKLTSRSSFKVLLQAVRQLSEAEGIHEDEAARAIIGTFRELDRMWDDVVYQEGLRKISSLIQWTDPVAMDPSASSVGSTTIEE